MTGEIITRTSAGADRAGGWGDVMMEGGGSEGKSKKIPAIW